MNMTTKIIYCPQCRQLTCRIWRHECNRFVCSGPGPCDEWEGECDNPACDWPFPQGSRAWSKRNPGKPYLALGKYADADAARIFSQKYKPLPAPYNRKKVR